MLGRQGGSGATRKREGGRELNDAFGSVGGLALRKNLVRSERPLLDDSSSKGDSAGSRAVPA